MLEKSLHVTDPGVEEIVDQQTTPTATGKVMTIAKIPSRIVKAILPQRMFDQLKWVVASTQLVKGDSEWAKNSKYDVETFSIMAKALGRHSTAIDVGTSVGKFISTFNSYSPDGQHFGFEASPASYQHVKKRIKASNISLYNMAVSNKTGTCEFNVSQNSDYSGLIPTKSALEFGPSMPIKLETDTLDNIIPKDLAVDFIKIDVEGAELWVLEGAKELLRRCKPVVVFEFESHANDYEVKPEEIFDLLESVNMNIWTTEYYLCDKLPLSRNEFVGFFNKEYETYFVSAPAVVDASANQLPKPTVLKSVTESVS